MPIAKTRLRERIVRKQEILLAAARVFIRSGFRLATMEEIATVAGLGVGTLYHYFDSKEQLFASLLAESAEILSARLAAVAAKRLTPTLGLVAINRVYADYFAEYPDYFRIQVFFQHDSNLGSRFAKERGKVRRLFRQAFELLAETIREGQTLGIFRRDLDPMATATLLWASYNGIFLAATNRTALEIADLSIEKLLSTAAFVHFSGLSAVPLPGVHGGGGAAASTASLADLREVVRAAPWVDPAMIFLGMPMAFQPARARGFHEVYQYRLSGPRGGVWTVVIDNGEISVTQGESAQPAIVVEMSDQDFVRLITGQVEAAALWTSGALKVNGDLQRAALFQTFFVPPDSNGLPEDPKEERG